MGVNTALVNVIQEQRNAKFLQWIAEVEQGIRKLAKTKEVVVKVFSFSNPTYVGPTQALIGIPDFGENEFYTTLYHMDIWSVAVDAAKIIYERIKEYNQA